MKKLPFYKQVDTMDCGPICLRMIAKFYGRSFSLQYIREKTQIGKEGVNLLGMSEAAEAIGFRTLSYNLSFQTLVKDAKLPAIIHWKQHHFIVLYRAKRGQLTIGDPSMGIFKLSEAEFKQNWVSGISDGIETGIALLLEPSPAFYENKDDAEEKKNEGLAFKNLFKYILPYKQLVFQLIIGLCVASLLQLFIPFLTQSIVDNGVNVGNIQFVYLILIAQVALLAGRLAVEFIRGWILLHISTRINVSILTDFLIKLMRLPVSYFDSKHTGDIMQRMDDHKRIESFLTGSSISVFFSMLNLIILSIVLAVFNIGIFTVFATASILYALWVILFLKKRKTLDYKTFFLSAKEQGTTIQLVQGMCRSSA